MKVAGIVLGVVLAGAGVGWGQTAYDFEVETIEGESTTLEGYRGQVLLVVNTASRCGFTPQYEGLQALHEQFGERGLVVLGFPCNDFGGQEPGTEAEIQEFCSTTYGVTFPMFGKVHVQGGEQHPLFRWLTEGTEGLTGAIRWNFSKFLIGRDGRLIARFGSRTAPGSEELVAAIERALDQDAAWGGGEPIDQGGDTYAVAEYFPLEERTTYIYRKTNEGTFRSRSEELERTSRWMGDVLRVEDSEGEYQDYRLAGEAPAMAGQSMSAQGFVQRYDDMILFPAFAEVGRTETYRTSLEHETRWGTQRGEVTREVTLVGVEDVETPAGVFRGCLKFEVRSENRPDVDGSFVARSSDTVWLAPGVGEVRSVSEVTLGNGPLVWMRATIRLELERVVRWV